MPNPLYDTFFGRHDGRTTPFLHLADGTTLTHGSFLERAARMAHVLTGAGLVPGDRLAVQVGKSADALALYSACARAGIVFLPLNPAYTTDELRYFVEDSGARALICDPSRDEALAPVAAALGARLETLGTDGSGSLPALAQGMPARFETADRDAGDLAALMYTSGTTGRSKGAMLTQANLISNARILAECWRFGPEDVLLHALPVFHTHGLFVATNITLIAGGAMILLPKFDPDEVIRLLPGATAMMGVPTFYTRLLDDPRLTRELVAHMRLFVSGSAPLLADTHSGFERRTGHRILERYGMTETNMNTSNPYDDERRAGTVGFALPGVEVRIRHPETGEEVPPGGIGQIEVRGPNVFGGYWGMPEKTAAELRADGFFLTGDLGRFDEDGYLHIVGRLKDLIISGGFNIYPKEIEALLDAEPGVAESAVVGVPHPDLGEAAVAVVVAERGSNPDPDTLLAAIGPRLARFKHPRRVIVAQELPRNTMGKVQKTVLRAQLADSFAATT